MNSRQLIEHTRNVLQEYESIRLGIDSNDPMRAHLDEPLIVNDLEILQQYLTKNQILGENQASFIRETYLGCIRQSHILEQTLKHFNKSASVNLLQKDYYLFQVICYLAMWRLEEIGFSSFSKFVICFEPAKMAALIGFLFNPNILQKELHVIWCFILDDMYVKERITDPLVHHISNGMQLKQDLLHIVENGMEITKSNVPLTKPEPFLLTVPKERKIPTPTYLIKKSIKPSQIPPNLFKKPATFIKLEQLKKEHKQQSLKALEKSNSTKFHAAKPKSASKLQELKQRLKQEEEEKHAKLLVKPNKPSFIKTENKVKLTASSILREEALLKKQRKKELLALEDAEIGIRDAQEYEKWKEGLKIKEEQDRVLEMERKRLQIQLLHEETFLAKQEQLKINKERAQEVLVEKQEIKMISSELDKELSEQNKAKIHQVNQIKEMAIKAKKSVLKEKVKQAQALVKEKDELMKQRQRDVEQERLRKVELIQQIKLLEKNVSLIQKEVDLTESSGFGLLGEMSIVELQERLLCVKQKQKDYAESKRKEIAMEKEKKELELVKKMQLIDKERSRQRQVRQLKTLPDRGLSVMSMQSDRSELKELMLESDPKLKSLYSKILQKKQASKSDLKLHERLPPLIPITLRTEHEIDEIEQAHQNYFS